jgi:hypothetical protein
MNQMLASGFRISLLLLACFSGEVALGGPGFGATAPEATLEIHAPDSVSGFWGRYFIIEKASRIAGWITSEDGAALYKINSIHASDATRFKAIVYVPGCALQAVDIPIAEAKNYQYSFRCSLIPQTQIQGTVSKNNNTGDAVTVEARYVASWASAFFQYDDGIPTEIPLGNKTAFSGQDKFSLQIPDLSKDKLASSPDHPGEIRIWVRDVASGRVEEQLRLTPNNSATPVSKMGGIPISALSDNGSVLHFCETDSFLTHDSFGFAIRNDAAGPCAH